MWKKILSIFDGNAKQLRRLEPIVEQVNRLEPEMQARSDEELRALTDEFKAHIRATLAPYEKGLAEKREALAHALEPEEREALKLEVEAAEKQLREAEDAVLWELLPQAFAAVREVSVRQLGMRHFDVQILGGIVLHEGKIAEMKTGEGKTLVATLPLYLNALLGKGAHLVTVNDYLARRDAEWMGKIYKALGLTVGVIQHDLGSEERRAAYNCDITYITNHEIGFDYLRDNFSVLDVQDLVLRDLHYAIVDEVDSILVDEARVPLIISGPSEKSPETYVRVNGVIEALTPGGEDKETKETWGDYVIDEKAKNATLTEEGQHKVERMLGIDNLNDPNHIVLNHHVQAALKAHAVYHRDVDYVVKDGEIIIVDEFTGRLMPGRRWSDGLHQAIEAKERVPIQRESQTLATITYQNFFRMYRKLAGMTGTAKTEEGEFVKIYGLEVVVIPTNKEMIREDKPDVIYKTQEWKYRGIVYDILETYARQQPVLVGSRSIEVSELLSRRLQPDQLRKQVLILLLQDKLREPDLDLEKERKDQYEALINAPLDQINERDLYQVARELDVPRHVLANENLERLQALFGLPTSDGFFRRALQEGIPHRVLNAKFHEQEAAIVAQAGRLGAVTIATNMAGRGTDILLGGNPEFLAKEEADPDKEPEKYAQALARYKELCAAEHEEVVKLGGLYILGSERHESRRIDNQLRGRSGRQGDPGVSCFYISVEDELMRLFGDFNSGIRGRLMAGWSEDEPIQAKVVSKAIENAQKKVEARNFEIRKNTLLYDDVMNVQRQTVYGERRRALEGANLRDTMIGWLADSVEDAFYRERGYLDQTLDDSRRFLRDLLEGPMVDVASAAAEAPEVALVVPPTLRRWLLEQAEASLNPAPERRTRARREGRRKEKKPEISWRRLLSGVGRVADPHYLDLRAALAWLEAQDVEAEDLEPEEVVGLIERSLEEAASDPREQAVREIYNVLSQLWPLDVFLLVKLTPVPLETLEACPTDELEALLRSPLPASLRGKLREVPLTQLAGAKPDQLVTFLSQPPRIRPDGEEIPAPEVAGEASVQPDKLRLVRQRLAELDDDSLKQVLNHLALEIYEVHERFLGPEVARSNERLNLLQSIDSRWMDHLSAMDHLREGIHWRAYGKVSEPIIAYRQEGYDYFQEMLRHIREDVLRMFFHQAEAMELRVRRQSGLEVTGEMPDLAAAAAPQPAAPVVGAGLVPAPPPGPVRPPQGRRQGRRHEAPEALHRPVQVEKIGRNEPCPCGSGKKYKKCCGQAVVA